MSTRVKIGIAVAAAVGIGVGAGAAYASIPGPDGKIHACYASTNGIWLTVPHSKGDVRIVDSSEACRNYEKAISWTQNPPPPTPAQLPRSLYMAGTVTPVTFDTSVITLNVPAGTWVFNFKAETANFGAECNIESGAGGFGVSGGDDTTATGTENGSVVPFTLTVRQTFPQPGTATVKCSTYGYDQVHPAVLLDPVMTAIEVAAP